MVFLFMAKNSPVWVQSFPRPPTSRSAGLLPAAAREHRASHQASSITSSITSHRIAQPHCPWSHQDRAPGATSMPRGLWEDEGTGLGWGCSVPCAKCPGLAAVLVHLPP